MKKIFAILAMLLATVCIFTSCSVELTVKDGCLVINGIETGINVDTEDTGIPEHTHTPAGFVIENEIKATCEKDGSYDFVIYCSYPGCNFEINRVNTVIESEGHSFENGICTSCGAEDPDYNPVCAEHKWSEEVVIITPHSIDNVGIALQTCLNCGYAQESTIGHTLVVSETLEATCTEDGYIVYNCDCGYSTTENLASLGHRPAVAFDSNNLDTSVWRECPNLDPETCPCLYAPVYMTTCTFDGCNELIIAIGYVEGHTWDEERPAENITGIPVCQWERPWFHKCVACDCDDMIECGRIEMTRLDPPDPHYWDEGVVTIDPTCTVYGVKTYSCILCLVETRTELIPALGHDMQDFDAVVPTCTYTGWDAYSTCHRCGFTTRGEYLPALGHSYGVHSETIFTLPTEDTEGQLTFICDRQDCGEECYTIDLPALTDENCGEGGFYTKGHEGSNCSDWVNTYTFSIEINGDKYTNTIYVEDFQDHSKYIEGVTDIRQIQGAYDIYTVYQCEKCCMWIIIDSVPKN